MHPLSPNLTEFKDDDLHKKFNELMSRLTYASNIGNFALAEQVRMLMDDYQNEIHRRNQKLLDEMSQKSDRFSGIINVK